MSKLNYDLTILDEAKSFNKIINTKEADALRKQIIDLKQRDFKDLLEYEDLKKEVNSLQKTLNKFDKDNLTPIKKVLKILKDDIVGQYQKQFIELKDFKKELEGRLVKKGLVEIKTEVQKNWITICCECGSSKLTKVLAIVEEELWKI